MSDGEQELRQAFWSFWSLVSFPEPTVARFGSATLDGRALPPELDRQGRALPVPVNALRALLYRYVYTRGSRTVHDYLISTEVMEGPAAVSEPDLAVALMRANAGRERWEGGWSVEAVSPNGAIRARKEHRARHAAAGEYALHRGPGLGPSVGEGVSLQVLPQSQWLQPGYYHVLGDTLSSDDEHAEVVRLYFAIAASGAAELLRLVSHRLNRYFVPFRGKWPASTAAYGRLDAAVLYVARRDYDFIAELLADVPTMLGPHLQGGVPLFSKRVARGVGLAEEPITGESFGMHRCRLLAEAIVCAHSRGRASVEAGWETLCSHFAERGHPADAPWLNPGSVDGYAPLGLAASVGERARASSPEGAVAAP